MKSAAARVLPGGERSARPNSASAASHAKKRRRSGVIAKRPTAISGATAVARPAPATRARSPQQPAGQHDGHGASVMATAVSSCAA